MFTKFFNFLLGEDNKNARLVTGVLLVVLAIAAVLYVGGLIVPAKQEEMRRVTWEGRRQTVFERFVLSIRDTLDSILPGIVVRKCSTMPLPATPSTPQ